MIAKWDGKCKRCGTAYRAGESIRYSNLTKQTFCVGCWGGSAEHRTRDKEAMAQIMERATAAHAAARAEQTEPAPAESPENGLGQAQPATLPAESPVPSDSYLAPLAAALARHMSLPAAALAVLRDVADSGGLVSKLLAERAQRVLAGRPAVPAAAIHTGLYL